jgi:hypothetical protein
MRLGEQVKEKLGARAVGELTPEALAAEVVWIARGIPKGLENTNELQNKNNRLIFIEWVKYRLFGNFKPENLENKIDQHFLFLLQFEIADLFDALENGKNHPLLSSWQEKRRHFNNRKSPTKRGSMLQECAVIGTEWLHSNGMTLRTAYEEVAKIANETGVYDEHLDHGNRVTPAAVRHWRANSSLHKAPPEMPALSIDLNLTSLDLNYADTRTFRFWRELIRLSMLGIGTSVLIQMMYAGRDPFENFPEHIRELAYGKSGIFEFTK